MQYLKYKGEFLSRNNTVCSVEILLGNYSSLQMNLSS